MSSSITTDMRKAAIRCEINASGWLNQLLVDLGEPLRKLLTDNDYVQGQDFWEFGRHLRAYLRAFEGEITGGDRPAHSLVFLADKLSCAATEIAGFSRLDRVRNTTAEISIDERPLRIKILGGLAIAETEHRGLKALDSASDQTGADQRRLKKGVGRVSRPLSELTQSSKRRTAETLKAALLSYLGNCRT
ncbi:MAG: hypothetical protein E5W94_00575 [Mesorhizobium sp.]|nr:MAG: hypothetical protein E5W94_00575 [Mesorhizobium sp.]